MWEGVFAIYVVARSDAQAEWRGNPKSEELFFGLLRRSTSRNDRVGFLEWAYVTNYF